jgi:hypothetical protein
MICGKDSLDKGIKAPKILMFAPLCYPPAGSEAIVTSKLVIAMKNAGWDIDVISQADFGRYYPVDDDDMWTSVREAVTNIHGIKDKGFWGVILRLCPHMKIDRLRTLFWVCKAVFMGLKYLYRNKYDFLFSRVAPLYGHLPALIISVFTKTPWIANWSDPMPSQKAPRPYGDGPDAIVPFFLKKYCEAVINNADWHTFPCERLQKYFTLCFDGIEAKSSVVPHIAIEKLFTKPKVIKDSFTLCHVGHLTLRDPGNFLAGVRKFLEKTQAKELRLHFIGHSFERLRKVAKDLSIGHILSCENDMPYTAVQAIAAESAVLVVIEAPCEEGIFFPSKFVDFIQTGRPILAVSPIKGTLNDILSQNGGGIAADARSPQSVTAAIEELYRAWQAGALVSKYRSDKLFPAFSEKKVIENYYNVMRSLHSEY